MKFQHSCFWCHLVTFPPFGNMRGKKGDKGDKSLNEKRTLRLEKWSV